MSEGFSEGWTITRLGELFDFKYGKGLPQEKRSSSGSIKVYGSNGVVGVHDSAVTRGPTIIVGRKGSVGEVHLSPERCWPIDTTYFIDDFPADLPPGYWAYFLRSLRLGQQEKSSAVPGISRDDIYRVEVPVPPLAEQRRIVANLEKLLERIDACRGRLVKIPVLLQRFRQSILNAACSGRLTADWREQNSAIEPAQRLGDGEPPASFELPSTWNWLLSTDAFGFITSGSRGWAKYYTDEGAVFIRVGNLNHDSIDLDLTEIQHVSPPAGSEGTRTRVHEGDILISITADVGMIALVHAGLEEAYINQHVALARPTGNMDRKYLAYFLAAKNGGQEQFLNLQRGMTKVGLGLDDIRSIWLARPPIAEQQEIVRRVEAFFALADQIEGRLALAKTDVDGLTPSILGKAFRGELVLTEAELAAKEGREYEPAEALLERVREQRIGRNATTQNKIRVRRRRALT